MSLEKRFFIGLAGLPPTTGYGSKSFVAEAYVVSIVLSPNFNTIHYKFST